MKGLTSPLAFVAQRTEHPVSTRLVEGSNPSKGTKTEGKVRKRHEKRKETLLR